MVLVGGILATGSVQAQDHQTADPVSEHALTKEKIVSSYPFESRLYPMHDVRPSACRGHPDGSTCGYYVFLMSERSDQNDPKYAVRAYNVPGEDPQLEEF